MEEYCYKSLKKQFQRGKVKGFKLRERLSKKRMEKKMFIEFIDYLIIGIGSLDLKLWKVLVLWLFFNIEG